LDLQGIAERMFMVMLQDFMDPWTFNQKNVMKCCKAFLLPGSKQIPFCAYNSVGYREQARAQLATRERARACARRAGVPFEPEPLTFTFDRPEMPRFSSHGNGAQGTPKPLLHGVATHRPEVNSAGGRP
jgi:hypothetical protein